MVQRYLAFRERRGRVVHVEVVSKAKHLPVELRHGAPLSDAASRLNTASDELAQAVVEPIDAALKKLNLGITAWHKYISFGPDEDGDYSQRCIGYAKVGGKWGLALSEESGNEAYPEPDFSSWLFNDAPRSYRVESIDHIPDLLEKLVKAAETAALTLQGKSKQAHEIAKTIGGAASTQPGRR